MREKKMSCEVCDKEVLFTKVNDPSSPLHQKLDSSEGVLFERKCFCNDCWNKMLNGFEVEEENGKVHYDGISKKLDDIIEKFKSF